MVSSFSLCHVCLKARVWAGRMSTLQTLKPCCSLTVPLWKPVCGKDELKGLRQCLPWLHAAWLGRKAANSCGNPVSCYTSLHPAGVVQKTLNISCNLIGWFLQLFEWLNCKTGVLPSTWFNFDLVLLLSLWFWWVLYSKTQFCVDTCISCLLHNLVLNILVTFSTGCFFLELSSLSFLLFPFPHKICFNATVCSAA